MPLQSRLHFDSGDGYSAADPLEPVIERGRVANAPAILGHRFSSGVPNARISPCFLVLAPVLYSNLTSPVLSEAEGF